jgi:hypothetical protein
MTRAARRRRIAPVLAVLLGALGSSACLFIPPRQPRPTAEAGEWAEVRQEATRARKLYDGLVHRATAIATHLTPKVREARASRLADWLAWTPAELDQRLAQERAEAAQGEEFVLAFYTADLRANDLDAPRSIWRVAVVVDGLNVLASRAEAIPLDATLKALYPLVGPFDTVYRVRFPPAPEGPLTGRAFLLRLSSALGTVDLDFGAPPGLPPGLDSVPPATR